MADAWLSCAWTPRVLFEAFTPHLFNQQASAADTRSDKRVPGNTAPSPETPMSHGNRSIRLAARRSERNTHIRRRRSSLLLDHPQRKRGCLRQRFAERLALGCGGRKATAYAQMRELPDSSAPERSMNSRSGLKRRISHQRHGFEIGMHPRRALCGKAEGQFNTAMARIIGDPTGTSF